MAIAVSDINIVLSGGTSNSDPNESTGGNPSAFPVLEGLNNLFSDITQEESVSGLNDYRCIYLFNSNTTTTFKTVSVSLVDQTSGGSTLSLGTLNQREIQKIRVSGTVTGGTFTLKYSGFLSQPSVVVSYSPSLTIWAANIKTALDTISEINGVTVQSSSGVGFVEFTISFSGNGDNRYHEPLEATFNNLVGINSISISKTQNGSPKNSIAPQLDFTTTEPSSVTFSSSISIGDLLPEEGLPIWIKRTTPASTLPLEQDQATLRITGTPF